MIGAVIGDIAGSFREFSKQKHNKYCDLPLIPTKEQIDEFKLKVGVTDDTVLTYATLKTLSEHKLKLTSLSYNDFALNYKEIGLRYFDPIGGYGC
jgi:ADP-ribosylglycohydrolase